MRPMTQAVTGSATGATAALPMDVHKNPFNVGIGVTVSATATYDVEYSFDGGTTWFDHPNMTAKTASAEGNIAFPVSHVRLNVAANSGSVTMTVIQAGI